MNKTNILSSSEYKETDKIEAQEYFKEIYPDIAYIEESDSFLYRDYEFNYFKSGKQNKFVFPEKGSYTLVDKDFDYVWLFKFGDQEVRWNEYLRNRANKIKSEEERAQQSHYYKNLSSLGGCIGCAPIPVMIGVLILILAIIISIFFC